MTTNVKKTIVLNMKIIGVILPVYISENGKSYIPISVVCDELSLDRTEQWLKITGNPTLRSSLAIVRIPKTIERQRTYTEVWCLESERILDMLLSIRANETKDRYVRRKLLIIHELYGDDNLYSQNIANRYSFLPDVGERRESLVEKLIRLMSFWALYPYYSF